MIHPSAIISDKATLGEQVEIGPYCVIGDHVTLGDRCKLQSHVAIEGHTEIGSENEFFPFAAIGMKTQDLKYEGEPTSLIIGNRNTFRENTTIHRSTDQTIPTRIAHNNLFLAYSHVAHDCQVGSNCILSNNGAIAGHVTIGDHVIISGFSGVHQFCRVGDHAIVGGFTKITQDVPPYMIADGAPGKLRGLNLVGLQRRGFSEEQIQKLKLAYRKIFFKKGLNLNEAVKAFKEENAPLSEEVEHLLRFTEETERGMTR